MEQKRVQTRPWVIAELIVELHDLLRSCGDRGKYELFTGWRYCVTIEQLSAHP
jgi:hypothetical protein